MSTRTISYSQPVGPDMAAAVLVAELRDAASRGDLARRSPDLYDLDLANVIRRHLDQDDLVRSGPRPAGSYKHDLRTGARAFYDAAWDLCARGVIRPIAYEIEDRGTSRLVGHLFAITAFGQAWLTGAKEDLAVPSEYGRFATLLAVFADDYGPAYWARSQEALRCYQAQCYLACCTMSGAAAEAILLALTIRRVGDESKVLAEYQRARGRDWLVNQLKSGQNAEVHRQVELFADLLKYWRDTAAHGADTAIHEAEAFTALLLVLRFAQFAADRGEAFDAPRPHEAR
jgi:hypothetical protein